MKKFNKTYCTYKNNIEKYFSQEDSIYIFRLSKNCKVTKYGYAKNEDRDFFIIS